MNGAKAKSLMIGAFLLLNIFLGYQLWGNEEMFSRDHNRIEANEVASAVLTTQMNISLSGDLPLDTPAVDILEVERMPLSGEATAELLWPDQPYQYNTEQARYYWEKQSLTQLDPYTLYYRDDPLDANTRCLDADFMTKHLPRALEDRQYLAIGEPLLKFELQRLLGLDFSKYYLDHIELIQEEDAQYDYKMFFVQKFVYPLFDRHSYTTVTIDAQGTIRELEMEMVAEKQPPKSIAAVFHRLKAEMFTQQKSSILSAAEALFIYFGNRVFKPEHAAIIDKVYLAYYSYGMEELAHPSDTLVSWDIIPVWCVILDYQNDDGANISETIYLNAFTGRQEKHLPSGIQ